MDKITKFSVVAIVFFLSLSAWAVSTSDVAHSKAVDDALQSIKMTRSDLALNRDYVSRDGFRLSLIDKLFDLPLEQAGVVENIAESIYGKSPESQLGTLCFYLDIMKDEQPVVVNEEPLNIAEKVPPVLNLLIKGFNRAYPYYVKAFEKLSAEEILFLREELPLLLTSEEEDEVDSLAEMKEAEYRSRETICKLTNLLLKFDEKSMLTGAAIMGRAVEEGTEFIKKTETIEPFEVNTVYGKIIIGSEGDDVYENPFIVIEPGGHDRYFFSDNNNPFSIIIDRSGEDSYSGRIASGFFGVAFLTDMEGDDIYKGDDFSLGCGFLGVSCLRELSGNDSYRAGSCSTGAGVFGVGLLEDFSGNDSYYGDIYSQGFGFTKGIGILQDNKGNDSYYAVAQEVDNLRYDDHYLSLSQGFGYGLRPYWSGGIGLIIDRVGNDSYVTDIYGQGSAYWFALGGILDNSGNDNYSSFQYAQGSGIHFAFGVLLDESGNDSYRAHGVSQGCGHDVGAGILIDVEGEDYYTTEGLSQGGGNANAVSVFIDGSGNDAYLAVNGNTRGWSDLRRGYGGVGLFLDLGGKDVYGGSMGEDNCWWLHSTYGAGIDSEYDIPNAEEYSSEFEFSRKAGNTVSEDCTVYQYKVVDEKFANIENLFFEASAAHQKFQNRVEPARAEIVKMGKKAMPYLVTKLDTDSARESHAIYNIIPRIGKDGIKPLLKVLNSGSKREKAIAIALLGKIGDKRALENVREYCHSELSTLRAGALEALATIDVSAAEEMLVKALSDSEPMVVFKALKGLGRLESVEYYENMISLLNSDKFYIRYEAEKLISRMDKSVLPLLYEKAEKLEGIPLYHLISAMGKIDGSEEYLKEFGLSGDWTAAGLAIKCLRENNVNVDNLGDREENLFIKSMKGDS